MGNKLATRDDKSVFKIVQIQWCLTLSRYIIMHVHKVHRFPKTSQVAHFTRLESYVLRAFSFCTSQQAATIALKEGIEIDLIVGLRSTWLLQRTELDIAKSVWHSCSWRNLMTYKVPKRYLATSCKIFPNENPEQNQIGFTFLSEFYKYRITWLSNRWKRQGGLCCRFVRLRWSTTSLTFQPTIAVQVCWKILRQMEECLGTLSEFVPQKSHWLAVSTPSSSVCLLSASRLETFKQCWMVKSKPMTEKVENFRRISHGLKWLWPEGTRTLLVEHLNFWAHECPLDPWGLSDQHWACGVKHGRPTGCPASTAHINFSSRQGCAKAKAWSICFRLPSRGGLAKQAVGPCGYSGSLLQKAKKYLLPSLDLARRFLVHGNASSPTCEPRLNLPIHSRCHSRCLMRCQALAGSAQTTHPSGELNLCSQRFLLLTQDSIKERMLCDWTITPWPTIRTL